MLHLMGGFTKPMSCCSHGKHCLHISVKGITLKANTVTSDHVLLCGELFGQRFRYSSLPVLVQLVYSRALLTHVLHHST